MGLDHRTSGSRPELKADTQPLSRPGAPLPCFLGCVSDLKDTAFYLFFTNFFLIEREREEGGVGETEGEGKRERERERERISSKLPAGHRAQHGARTHDPEVMTLAEIKSQMLN